MILVECDYKIELKQKDEIYLTINLEADLFTKVVEFINKEQFINLYSMYNALVLQSINILSKDQDSSDVINYDLYLMAIGDRNIKGYTSFNLKFKYGENEYKININKKTGFITHGV